MLGFATRLKSKPATMRTLMESVAFVIGFTLPIVMVAVLMSLFVLMAGCVSASNTAASDQSTSGRPALPSP
jgi:hypothetical protein